MSIDVKTFSVISFTSIPKSCMSSYVCLGGFLEAKRLMTFWIIPGRTNRIHQFWDAAPAQRCAKGVHAETWEVECSPQMTCLCVFVLFFFTATLVEALSHLLLVQKTQTCVKLLLEQKWFQQKPGMGPRLPSQAARVLIIAVGFESLLKQPRACVHVFKKQCYVSACHLEAFRSPVLSHSRSFSFSRS